MSNAEHTPECLARTRNSLEENLSLDWHEETITIYSSFWETLDEQVRTALADGMFCAEHGCPER